MSNIPVLAAFLVFAVLWRVGSCCHPKDMVRGWKVDEGSCHNGYGCNTEYKFLTETECRASIKGQKKADVCSTALCAHGGLCTQVAGYNQKYKCRCEGTGYYGPRCQYSCPIPGTSSVKKFPYECIVI